MVHIDLSAAINTPEAKAAATSAFSTVSTPDFREIAFRLEGGSTASAVFTSNWSSMDLGALSDTGPYAVDGIAKISNGGKDYHFQRDADGKVTLERIEIPEGTTQSGLIPVHKPAEEVRMTDAERKAGYDLYQGVVRAIGSASEVGLVDPKNRLDDLQAICETPNQLYSIGSDDPFTQVVKIVEPHDGDHPSLEEFKVIKTINTRELRFPTTAGASLSAEYTTVDELLGSGLVEGGREGTNAKFLNMELAEDPLRNERVSVNGRREISVRTEGDELVVTVPKAYRVHSYDASQGALKHVIQHSGLIPFSSPQVVSDVAAVDAEISSNRLVA